MTGLDKMALMACPFCGGRPRTGTANSGVPGMEDCGYAYIECCDVHVHREEDEECASAWNRRAALLAPPPGYALLPIEPTDVQLMWMGGHDEESQRRAYAGLIATAPEVKS